VGLFDKVVVTVRPIALPVVPEVPEPQSPPQPREITPEPALCSNNTCDKNTSHVEKRGRKKRVKEAGPLVPDLDPGIAKKYLRRKK
jgi:hypothetical protein